jgi:hypothetical protein
MMTTAGTGWAVGGGALAAAGAWAAGALAGGGALAGAAEPGAGALAPAPPAGAAAGLALGAGAQASVTSSSRTQLTDDGLNTADSLGMVATVGAWCGERPTRLVPKSSTASGGAAHPRASHGVAESLAPAAGGLRGEPVHEAHVL